MAKNVNIETIQFKLQDFGKLKAVDKTFNKLNKSIGFSKKEINEAIKSITRFDQRNKGANNTATRSVATFNQQIAALKELQNNVAIGGKAYKAFGAEADRLRAKLEALTGTQKKRIFRWQIRCWCYSSYRRCWCIYWSVVRNKSSYIWFRCCWGCCWGCKGWNWTFI